MRPGRKWEPARAQATRWKACRFAPRALPGSNWIERVPNSGSSPGRLLLAWRCQFPEPDAPFPALLAARSLFPGREAPAPESPSGQRQRILSQSNQTPSPQLMLGINQLFFPKDRLYSNSMVISNGPRWRTNSSPSASILTF